MSAAVLRHAAPLMTLRAPLFAGLGAAGLFAILILTIAVFGNGEIDTPAARGDVEPLPASVLTSVEPEAEYGDAISFVEPGDGAEASLDGVPEGFETYNEPAAEDVPASAPTRANTAAPANPEALPRAPMAGLSERGPGGLLPVIGPNGERVSRAYARPFHGDPNTPMIAIVVGGMGLNARVTEAAIDNLPPEVALSFAPYASDLQSWIDRARAAGHEVLIEAPMEPFDYPNDDPGPHTLLADGPAPENERRLAWILSRTTGYFGVTNYLGARFSTSAPALTQVLESLERRGVAFLHDGNGRRSLIDSVGRSTGALYAIADRIVDEDPSPSSIDDRLLALEALAIQNGAAMGTGFAYPATVEQIEAWAEGIELRGYQLAPPSAVMARRRLEARLAAEAAGDDHAADNTNHRWADNAGEEAGDEYGGGDDYGH
ncbi:divergent polysaccharide deacetylase family protein [Maricaulis sp.]|uniref:divergent polysaccharide deacetylase family protein n=1 Tax=Maricaulis sp. TaxID=1486257 RepID=UPI00261D7EA3|nr:divergent polysaccharide deacetylase family protein [Maricaulis sp.]